MNYFGIKNDKTETFKMKSYEKIFLKEFTTSIHLFIYLHSY